jgi:hypothetical protein
MVIGRCGEREPFVEFDFSAKDRFGIHRISPLSQRCSAKIVPQKNEKNQFIKSSWRFHPGQRQRGDGSIFEGAFEAMKDETESHRGAQSPARTATL